VKKTDFKSTSLNWRGATQVSEKRNKRKVAKGLKNGCPGRQQAKTKQEGKPWGIEPTKHQLGLRRVDYNHKVE